MEHRSKRLRLSRLVESFFRGDSSKDIGSGSDPPAMDRNDAFNKEKESAQPAEISRPNLEELKRRAQVGTNDALDGEGRGTRHRHRHRRLQHRHAQADQAAPVALDASPVVTSVIRVQVVVDDLGNTLTQVIMPVLPTVPAVPPFPSLAIPTVPSVPAFPTLVIPTVPPYPFPASSESQVPVSQQAATPNLTTSPPNPTSSSSSYSSFNSFGNSTTTGIPCNTTASSNTTTLSFAASYATTLTLTSSTTLSESSSSSTGSSPTSTPGNGVVAGSGTPTGGGSVATGAAGTASGIQKPAVIGGVVGGLAGLALILIIALFLIRWKKQHDRNRALQGGEVPGHSRSVSGPSTGAVTERSSMVPLAGAAIGSAGFLKRFRPISQQTAASDTTAPSERGFYKVSGRKIPSVLGGGGGDGYGGGYDKETLGSSYRDSSGLYSASSAPGSPRGATAAGLVRSEKEFEAGGIGVAGSSGEKVFMRPSPARTPVSSQGPVPGPSGTPPIRPPRPFRDGLGRSHPSEDGSKASKFMEDV